MEHPVTAPWGMHITGADFEKLKGGFVPQMMEERWGCSADDLDPQGRMMVRLSRSRTSREQIVLVVKLCSDDDGAEIFEITWDQGSGEDQLTELDGKSMATSLCRSMKGCEWVFYET